MKDPCSKMCPMSPNLPQLFEHSPIVTTTVFDSKIHTMTFELDVVLLVLLLFGVGLLFALVLSHYKLLRKVHDLAAALPAEMTSNTDALGCGIATAALALEEVQKILQMHRPIVRDGSPISRTRLNFSKADHD